MEESVNSAQAAMATHDQPRPSSSSPTNIVQTLDRIHYESKPKSGAGLHTTFFGKHRLSASINNLQNEIKILQEELERLESLGGSSIVCKELVLSVESIPDPLLPLTKGPAHANWDQWFRGAHNTRNHKRWI